VRAKQPAAKRSGQTKQTAIALAFAKAMDSLGAPWPGAVALSGGGDSLALMHLLSGWARTKGLAPPIALIVDHALRKESAAEARKPTSRGAANKACASSNTRPSAALAARASTASVASSSATRARARWAAASAIRRG